MRNLRNTQGFTLIELMIVVVIIGILAAIAIPRFTAVSDQAKQAEAGPILKQMCSLAESELMKTGEWPDAVGDLTGWADPGAKHFDTWTITGGGDATTPSVAGATAITGGLADASMNCETKVLTP